MSAQIKKELILDNLGCAHCAAKIEQQVNDLSSVTRASLNFATKTLVVEIPPETNLEAVLQDTRHIIHKLEPDVELRELIDEPIKLDSKRPGPLLSEILSPAKLIRLSIGMILFAIPLLLALEPWIELALFLASYLLIGGVVLIHAGKNILRGQVFDENFLMSLATVGAFAIGEYPEAVAVMIFYEIGELFEKMAIGHSRRSISALMDIRPDYANLKSGEAIIRVAPDQVRVGDVIVVKPGEKVPLDAQVIEGTSMLDTSAITGESVPRSVRPGDVIYSGSLNKNGRFVAQVTKVYGESTVSRILDLVQNASAKKAPTEKFITRFAHYYTPAVVLFAAALAVIPPLVLPGATFADWLYRALIFLVVSCPCALVISIPLGFFGGIGGASKHGILVKGSNYLEALNQVDTVVFDKTGTLTQGVFKVTQVHSEVGSEQQLLELAAYAESFSNHPIALSILSAFGQKITPDRVRDYDEVPGLGIQATVDDQIILAGSARFLESAGIQTSMNPGQGTIVHVAVDRTYAGYLVIADEIKPDAAQAVAHLKSIGVRRVVMLTGDNKIVGEAIGRALGLDEVYANLLPDQKVDQLERLEQTKTTRGKLVFIGDGINDAPVLARADVGMAMGGLGSDAAIEAADIVIMTDQPSKVAEAILISRRTIRIVRQNIILAFAVKAAVLMMSVGGVATMWEAVFADIGVAILAILNAMRVLNAKSTRPE